MKNDVTPADIYPILNEILENSGSVTLTPTGKSMRPMLNGETDTVTLEKCPEKLKRNDLPFYRRRNGKFVIHRVVSCDKDGTYTMCGDNQYCLERGIEHDQFIGIVTSFTRKGKSFSTDDIRYKIYCNFWTFVRYFRRLCHKIFC